MSEPLVPVYRPNNTLIWLPIYIAARLGLERGVRLSDQQYEDHEIQALIRSKNTTKREKK